MSARTMVLALIAAGVLLLAGCAQRSGSTDGFTRHRPSSAELTWESDMKQLPWREPALEDTHYPRRGAMNYMPRRAKRGGMGNQETHIDQRHRAGRHTFRQQPGVRH